MRLIPILALCAAVLTVSQTALAQVKAGTVTATFLELPVSARGMGMADALLPIADDVSAIYFNPAGLTQLEASCSRRIDSTPGSSWNVCAGC